MRYGGKSGVYIVRKSGRHEYLAIGEGGGKSGGK